MRSTLDLGQINIVLLAVVLADACSVRSRRRGVLIGLAGAVKLTPLVFLAWLVVMRDRAAAVRGAVTFAIATALTWAVLPSDSTRYWLHDLFDPGRIGRLNDPLNQSLNGTVERVVGSGTPATVVWAMLAAATLAVGLLSARRLTDRGLRLASLSAVAISGLLASPVSWPHHWVWVFPATVAGWDLRRDRPALARASAVLAAVTAISPWRLADVPVARDAWVIAGVGWLLVALLGDRDRPWRRRSGQEQPLVLPQLEQT
jgi:alpha-1,2-mannosyltransferase